MAADKILNDIKVIDSKIIKKEQELESLKDKKEKCKAKLVGTLMQDNNLTIDDVVELFQGSTPITDNAKTKTEPKEVQNG